MKNKLIKLISFMLVIMFCFTALAACGGDDDDDGDDGVQAVTGSGEARFDGVNFNGKSVTITMSNCQDAERVGADVAKYMAGANTDGSVDTNDQILMSVKNRNDYVTGKLGLTIKYDYMSEGWQELSSALKNRYDAHDTQNPIDGVANQLGAVYNLMMMGIFRNANTTAKTNYFDFEDKSWYADAMQSLSFGADMKTGKKFLLVGDYFIDTLRCIDIIIVNENRLQAAGYTTDAFYEYITSGEWDYDLFNTMVLAAFRDGASGTPGATDKNDNLGIVYAGGSQNNMFAAAIAMAMVHSSNIDYITSVGGNYQYLNNSTINTSFAKLTEAAKNLVSNSGALALSDAAEVRTVFASGQSLFATGLRLYDLENKALDTIAKNPIPFPKLDMSDPYKAYIHDNASVGAIFNTSQVFTELSAFWQYCTIKSEETRINYYEKGLGLKYDTSGNGKNSKAMLDILYNAMTVDDYVLDRYVSGDTSESAMFTILMSVASGDSELSSAWAAVEEVKRSGLGTVVGKYNGLNAN